MNFPFRFLSAAEGNANALTPVFERRDYDVCTVEYVTSGRGFLEVNGKRFQPEADCIYFLPKHSDHQYYPDRTDPWQKLFIVVDGSFMEELIRIYNLDNIYCFSGCGHMKHWFEHWVHENDQSRTDEQYAVEFHQFTAELADHIRTGQQKINPYVRKLYDQLHLAFEKKFSLSDFAADTPYTEVHLIRLFQQKYHITPYKFRMKLKMEQAKVLLLHSALSVKEIADHLGFFNAYHFSSYFKKWYGKSPVIYRKIHAAVPRKL